MVLESTTYPGTTREVVLPILEQAGSSPAGTSSWPSAPSAKTPATPIRRADHSQSRRRARPGQPRAAAALYGKVIDRVVPVSTPEVAEACKILENTYRAVNIALVNELKMLYDRMGIDVWEVIEAAKTKPFGFQAFYPGPGLGGHCIPIDPFYLTWMARKHGLTTRFIELAGEINTSMPAYVVNKVADALNDRGKPVKGSQITLWAWPTKRTWTTRASRPASSSWTCCCRRGPWSSTTTRTSPRCRRCVTIPTCGWPAGADRGVPGVARRVLIVTDHSAYDWGWIVGMRR